MSFHLRVVLAFSMCSACFGRVCVGFEEKRYANFAFEHVRVEAVDVASRLLKVQQRMATAVFQGLRSDLERAK